MVEGAELNQDVQIWNVASGYTLYKILTPLIEMDKLVKISIYGTETIEASQVTPPEVKIGARIEAIKRLVDSILMVIENSKFALKKDNKINLEQLELRTRAVSQVTDAICTKTYDARNNYEELTINEIHFKTCLDELRKIKQELSTPLITLIFPSSEEIDLAHIKEQLVMGG